jgi:hypothetical protein
MPLLPKLTALSLFSALALLPACGSSTSIGMVIPPGATATGSVTGRLPSVELRNDGPEWIEAQIHTIDGEGFDGRLGPGGSAAHKLPGPLRIRIENRGSERAMIVLEATGADGVSLKMPEKK